VLEQGIAVGEDTFYDGEMQRCSAGKCKDMVVVLSACLFKKEIMDGVWFVFYMVLN
jgi:hypothetical protein